MFKPRGEGQSPRPQALPDPVAGRSRKAGIHFINPLGSSPRRRRGSPWL